MTVPSFNDIFHPYYDQYSVPVDEISIPDHFDIFEPDNQNDYDCISVICPSLERGAKKWTIGNNFITIGIYRDEGRPATKRPTVSNLQWSRVGTKITISDRAGHKLKVGDIVSLYNINTPELRNVKVDSTPTNKTFIVTGELSGNLSGSFGAYQPEFMVSFNEDYRVFRLLPSFKLIPYSTVLSIFSDTAPEETSSSRALYNITSNRDESIPHGRSKSVNYELPQKSTSFNKLPMNRRFDQVYDENGNPLKIEYLSNGQPVPLNNVDSGSKNSAVELNQPIDGGEFNSRLYVYDYYGLDMNDVNRGPYFSDKNVVRSVSVNGIEKNLSLRKLNNGEPFYTAKMHDEFGNLAIGVQANNCLVVRRQVLPLVLDRFNRPIKDSF